MLSDINLTTDELAALHRGEPLHLLANDTQEVVVVLAAQYDRLRRLVNVADADPRSFSPLIADVSPEDWEELSAYPNAEKL